MEKNKLNTLPKRNEINPQYTWNLEDLYPSDEACKKDMENLKASLNSLLEYQDKLTSSSDNLFSCLSLYDKFSEIVEKVYVYSHMKLHQDTSNSLYQALSDKAKALSIDFSSASSFIIPEILKASDETLKAI